MIKFKILSNGEILTQLRWPLFKNFDKDTLGWNKRKMSVTNREIQMVFSIFTLLLAYLYSFLANIRLTKDE